MGDFTGTGSSGLTATWNEAEHELLVSDGYRRILPTEAEAMACYEGYNAAAYRYMGHHAPHDHGHCSAHHLDGLLAMLGKRVRDLRTGTTVVGVVEAVSVGLDGNRRLFVNGGWYDAGTMEVVA